jgi:hypothetical protein
MMSGEALQSFVINGGRMASQGSDRSAPKYDRDFLLSPAKRNELIELWEVEKFGRDCFGDPDHVHLYGMPPKEWWGRGMRILARTCIEAVNDPFGDAIGGDIAKVITRAPGRPAIGVVDPFAGSCNGLYTMLRHLPAAKGIGFEIQQAVFDLTTRNISRLNAPIDLVLGSYKDDLASHRHPRDHLIVAFLAPPWGDALHPVTGLHLDRTKPPILEIVCDFEKVYGFQPVLYVTQVLSLNEPAALKAVESAFDWTDLRVYNFNVPGVRPPGAQGRQPGILLGTRRWSPQVGP